MPTPKTAKHGGLSFSGDGSRFIPGVPARDLTPEEVGRLSAAVLIASGLYTEAAPPAADESPSADGKE